MGLQSTGFERRKLVEQRRDYDGPDSDHEHLETSSKQPEVVEELLSGLLDDRKEGSQDGRSQDDGQAHRLDLVRDVQLRRLLVETEFLLQHEGMVNRSRGRNDLVNYREGQDKDDRLRDFASKSSGGEFEEQTARP